MSLHSTDNNQQDISFNDLKTDDAAFEAFFKKQYTPLCAYCQYKFGFDFDQTIEIVHTAFVKLWEARQNLSGDVSPITYLQRTITNSSLDILRHEKVKQQYARFVQHTTTEESSLNSVDSIDYKQLHADIDNTIAELPEQMRRIFMLSRFEGLKYAEIAAQLNISVKTVETQMSRALAKLRTKLSGYLTLYFILLIISIFGKR
jgi:RNA polymerase sigma-70 factor (ECF subfamily)